MNCADLHPTFVLPPHSVYPCGPQAPYPNRVTGHIADLILANLPPLHSYFLVQLSSYTFFFS